MLLVLCLAAGCASLGIGNQSTPDERPDSEVGRLAAFWLPASGYEDGRLVDGFVGKVLLFGGESFSPIQARGRLVIYAFHDTKDGSYEVAPNRRWEFSPDELPGHLEKTMLGPTYAFWVPWQREADAKGAVSLQVAFVPEGEASAGPVVSPTVRIALPEKQAASQRAANAASNSPAEVNPRQPNLKTETISLGARVGSALPVVEAVGIRREDQPKASVADSLRESRSAHGVSGLYSPTRSLAPRSDDGQLVTDRIDSRFQPSDRFRQQPFMVGKHLPFQNHRRPFLANDDSRAAEDVRTAHPRRETLGDRGGTSLGNGESDAKAGTK